MQDHFLPPLGLVQKFFCILVTRELRHSNEPSLILVRTKWEERLQDLQPSPRARNLGEMAVHPFIFPHFSQASVIVLSVFSALVVLVSFHELRTDIAQ